MASKFQNRLVGTIILVAIGVIVLPDLLDGKKIHYQDSIASIPIQPDLTAQHENVKVVKPEVDNASLPASPVQAETKAEVNSVAKNEGHLSAGSVPVTVKSEPTKVAFKDSAWIIQLMALKNTNNAGNLVKYLKKRGYQAHTKKENGFTRVIIGPNVSKDKLERQLVELEKITRSKGRLLKFNPLNP